MTFAAALTLTAVVLICASHRSIFYADAIMSLSNNKTEIPSMYYCNNTIHCPEAYGFGSCMNHLCVCDANFYQMYNATTGKTHCRLCSLFRESCAETQCCQNSRSTYCLHGTCICKPGMDEECLGRYTPTLGIQLANTLSVSFAFVFLAITFVAIVRKTLFRCTYFRCDTISRVGSNSSLNEFIKQKMQNRPPCYDDIEKDRKVPIDTYSQAPPEYNSMYFGRTPKCHKNPTFSISDEVEMNSAPPPNYSTFTTVTDTTAVASSSSSGRARNDEIVFITRPIYVMNSSRNQT